MEALHKIGILLFVGLLSFPSTVDFLHVVSGHQHDYCNHYSESHFHENNLDCDIFEFQQRAFSSPEIHSYTFFVPKVNTSVQTEAYQFLSTYQQLPFSLRGPPLVA